MRTKVQCKNLLAVVMLSLSFMLASMFNANVAMAAETSSDGKVSKELSPAKAIFALALADYKNKNFDSAVKKLNSLIPKGYNDKMIYYLRGMSYLELKKHTLAATDFGNAIRLDSNDKNAYVMRATTYLDKKDYEKTLADLQTASTIDPNDESLKKKITLTETIIATQKDTPKKAFNDSESNVLLECMNLIDNHNHDRAIDILNNALEKYPNSLNLRKIRGMAYAETFNLDNALEDFQKALELDPNDKQSLKMVADLKSFMHNYKLD